MFAVSAIAGAYLVATFTSTGLAKLCRRKGATAGVISEAVIPERFAYITVLCISVLELTLAILIIATVQVFLVGLFTAGLFLAFGIYRALNVLRTGRISCNCAGTASSRIADLPEILGTLSASLAQSAVAVVWAFSPTPKDETYKFLLALVAVVPVAAYCAGIISTRSADRPRPRVQQDRSGMPRSPHDVQAHSITDHLDLDTNIDTDPDRELLGSDAGARAVKGRKGAGTVASARARSKGISGAPKRPGSADRTCT